MRLDKRDVEFWSNEISISKACGRELNEDMFSVDGLLHTR
jgi:hypothetical protein